MTSQGKPREARLKLLKQELVTQMLGKPGAFREEVEEIRAHWLVEDPQVQAPPESDALLFPPALSESVQLSELYDLWSNHPDLPPISDKSGRGPSKHEMLVGLSRRWQNDLSYALLRGDVPETYLKGPLPHDDHPPTSTRLRPWLRFAAACVLYVVPPEEPEAFIDYGGIPSLRGEMEGEPILGVRGPRQVCRDAIAAAEREAYEKRVFEKMWELRSELDDDPELARQEVMSRFSDELEAECARARRRQQHWMKLNRPRRYYIEFDPEVDARADVDRTIDAIWDEHGFVPEKHGNLAQGDLRKVQIARLLDEPGWGVSRIAARYGYTVSTVKKYGEQGRKILEGGH